MLLKEYRKYFTIVACMPEVYRKVSIPDSMWREIERIIKQRPELGYSSVAEFIKEAIRDKIRELKKEMIMK